MNTADLLINYMDHYGSVLITEKKVFSVLDFIFINVQTEDTLLWFPVWEKERYTVRFNNKDERS